jgi:STE24 endopeptidase
MVNTVFFILVAILVLDFLLERTLDFLNTKFRNKALPDEISDVYDQEQYRKQQEYKKVNDRFGMLTSAVSFAVILLMLFLGGFSLVDAWAREITVHPVLLVLVFFGILAFATDIINTPFSLYDIFVIEERFGFNRMTPKIYIADKLKGWLLGAIIGGGILALVVWFYIETGNLFWIYAWILAVGFSIFMAMFYSSFIVPLFNKQTPLPEGELKDAIKNFADKVGFRLVNIFVIDGSKRSTKSNAYFTGLGPKKRIVLFDTLIKDLSTEEIVAVLAHEIGHYKKRHIYVGLLAGIIQTGITLYVLSLMISHPALSVALGGDDASFHLGLIAFGILFSPISLVTGLLMNYISRHNEYAADQYVKENGNSAHLISALKRLSSKNLSNLTPHPVYVFFHYSHPTLLQRILALK